MRFWKDAYLVIEILQRFLPRTAADLHLPPAVQSRDVSLLGNDPVGIPGSGHIPASPTGQGAEIQRLIVGRALHRTEHATEFLPRFGAPGAHVLKEGRRILCAGHGCLNAAAVANSRDCN